MALFCILVYLLNSKLLKLQIKIKEYEWEFGMILEYISLGKGLFTGHWGRLEKFLPFYFRFITSYLQMSGMP
jgi:hypothetical protein